jgi:branched-chain amino acid transport system substrate-binding protein
MFGCWETLYIIKEAIEASGYQSATDADKKKLVEATEAMQGWKEGNEHPQGDKTFVGAIHQCFGHQFISKVTGGKLEVAHKTEIADGTYEPETDYTKMAL